MEFAARLVTHSVDMGIKGTQHQNFTDQPWLERVVQLCEGLQVIVDAAGDHYWLFELIEQTAQQLFTDQESKPALRKSRRCGGSRTHA